MENNYKVYDWTISLVVDLSTNLKLLAKTTVHGVYVINHTVLSKCDKFFIGDVIREKYNDEYKIDGDGSIILEY